jgi:hypothetical protein
MTNRQQCAATVWRRDTYRRTGRGPTGFEMHYDKGRCRRWAKEGGDLCAHHVKEETDGRKLPRSSFPPDTKFRNA